MGDPSDCLRNLHSQGEISKDEAAALSKLFKELTAHYGNLDEAKADLVLRLRRQGEHKQRQSSLNEAARARLEKYMLDYKNARGEPDPGEALIALIEHNGLVEMPNGASSVVGRAKAIEKISLSRLEELLYAHRRTWITGQHRNAARMENIVKEAAGQNTGDDAAKQFAKAWLEVAEELRMAFNAAGGAIRKLDGWFLPQSHDRLAMLRRNSETDDPRARWKEFIKPRLDMSKMRNPLTGKPMIPADLEDTLDEIYKGITSEGWDAKDPSPAPKGMAAISNQRADARFLHFKSPEDWMAYNREYGGGHDVVSSMHGYIRAMAEDIAAMEILGPNPNAMIRYLSKFVEKQASLKAASQPAIFPTKTMAGRSFEADGSWLWTKNPEDYAREKVKIADDMWGLYRHVDDAVVNQRVADVFGSIRNLATATKLGSASLSAVTDYGFQVMARRFAGLPVTGMMTDLLKTFGEGTRRDMARGGMIMDTAAVQLMNDARWQGNMQGPLWARYLADRVIASSGLNAMTNTSKRVFLLGFAGELASRANLTFKELPEQLSRAFKRYGLGEKDWDILRQISIDKDLDFLGPTEVFRALKEAGDKSRLAERYAEMLLQETEYSTPEGTLRAKAMAYGGLRRGTLFDEVRRSMGQFKMFGLSVAHLQGQRIMNELAANGRLKGAQYAAGLLITTTLLGALAMQLKEMAKGKDPRPMDKATFWGAALMQGGGLGIYGDFLTSETSRTGSGLARTIAGPTVDMFAQLLAVTNGNIAQYLSGQNTNTGRELVRLLGQNTPFGSNWYLRLAYERAVLDQLQKMVDPEAYASFRRKQQKSLQETGNGYYWRPGEQSADRLPKLSFSSPQ